MRNATPTLCLSVAAVLCAVSPAVAQWSQVHEQFYYPASHNWEFRERYRIADRLFNAFEYGHAILYETLYTDPDAPASKLEVEEYNFITRKLLPRPPRIPLEEGAIEIAYAKLAPEAKAMFEWAHVLHRQIYDVLAAERLTQEEKDAEVAALLRYYRSRREYAFSSVPKSMELMEGQYYSTVFRERYPKFNGLIWAYHWLQVGLYEPLMVGRNYDERQTGVAATVARFFQMIEDAPTHMPRVMPMTSAVAPVFTARYPEAAIIFDNLHSLHDVISDILASPEVPRAAKRTEILRAVGRYRDDTSFIVSADEWRQMATHMGLENMGGPAVNFLPEFPTPTLPRGAVMANMNMSDMPDMRNPDSTSTPAAGEHAGHAAAGQVPREAAAAPAHAGHVATGQPTRPDSTGVGQAGGIPQTPSSMSMEGMRAMHDRMMADPVIRERIATDPVLRRMMSDLAVDPGADHTAHGSGGAPADSAGRAAMEFVLLLLERPDVEARIHADPRMHALWSDPAVQQCLRALRDLKAAGKPLPAACPAAPPATHRH